MNVSQVFTELCVQLGRHNKSFASQKSPLRDGLLTKFSHG